MKYVKFTDEEKIANFDIICDSFFNANFGHLSKSDIELMMFNFYISKMVKDNSDNDGIIDFNKCSDYLISKELGITQQRVRNLKVKNQLINPIDFKWEKALAKLTENARYDKESHKVILNIPDPNLYIEIQNFIEENGAYVEKQLNSKVLQIRAEYYIALILNLEDEKSSKRIIKELKKQFRKDNKKEAAFDDNNIGKSLIEGTVNITSIAANISSLISPANCLGASLIKLLTA